MNKLHRYMTTLLRPAGATTGKNRYDKDSINWTNGKYISDTGAIASNANMCYSDLIPIYSSFQCVVWGIAGYSGMTTRVHEYDESGTWIKQLGEDVGVDALMTGTTSATTKYLRIGTYKNTLNEDTIQIEAGTTPTTYEPYSG